MVPISKLWRAVRRLATMVASESSQVLTVESKDLPNAARASAFIYIRKRMAG